MVAAAAVLWAGLSAIAAEAPKPALLPAVQTIYRDGVPHTDARGSLRMQYDPTQSFFQLGIWGNPIGTVYGHDYDLKVQYLEPGPGKPKASPALPMDLAADKALWMAATQINREVRELTPSLLSPTVDNVAFNVAAKGESPSAHPVRCLLKPHREGGYVLLTVNLEDAVLDVTFTFPATLAFAQPMSENRDSLARSPEGLALADRYEPFGVHVYRILPGKAAAEKRP